MGCCSSAAASPPEGKEVPSRQQEGEEGAEEGVGSPGVAGGKGDRRRHAGCNSSPTTAEG